MKLRCIKDVVMNGTGEKVFTEGKIYNGYRYRDRESTPFRTILCAKNDLGIRHGIKAKLDSTPDDFFDKHFVVVSDVYKEDAKPVDFQTAAQSGKRIRPESDDCFITVQRTLYWLSEKLPSEAADLIAGKWYVE